jgi:hypothetical protein
LPGAGSLQCPNYKSKHPNVSSFQKYQRQPISKGSRSPDQAFLRRRTIAPTAANPVPIKIMVAGSGFSVTTGRVVLVVPGLVSRAKETLNPKRFPLSALAANIRYPCCSALPVSGRSRFRLLKVTDALKNFSTWNASARAESAPKANAKSVPNAKVIILCLRIVLPALKEFAPHAFGSGTAFTTVH